jgi:hypothetical protein
VLPAITPGTPLHDLGTHALLFQLKTVLPSVEHWHEPETQYLAIPDVQLTGLLLVVAAHDVFEFASHPVLQELR